MEENKKTAFGNNLKNLREYYGYSRRSLAKAIGVNPATVSRWEKLGILPGANNLLSLADTFGITLKELIDEECFEENRRNLEYLRAHPKELAPVEVDSDRAISLRMTELVEEKNLVWANIARLMNKDPNTLSALVNHDRPNPKYFTIKTFCRAVGISVREFFDSPLFDTKL